MIWNINLKLTQLLKYRFYYYTTQPMNQNLHPTPAFPSNIQVNSITIPSFSSLYTNQFSSEWPQLSTNLNNWNQSLANLTINWPTPLKNTRNWKLSQQLSPDHQLLSTNQFPLSINTFSVQPPSCQSMKFEPISCPQQNGLSCLLHALHNSIRLAESNGQSTISYQEANQLDIQYRQTKSQFDHPDSCQICQFEKQGGIVLDPYTKPVNTQFKFMTALNQVKNNQRQSFTCIMIFQSHAVALHLSKNSDQQLVVKVADSDSPLTIHPNTRKALNRGIAPSPFDPL